MTLLCQNVKITHFEIKYLSWFSHELPKLAIDVDVYFRAYTVWIKFDHNSPNASLILLTKTIKMSLQLGNHVIFVIPLNIGSQKSDAVKSDLLVLMCITLSFDQFCSNYLDEISLNFELLLNVLPSDKEQWHITETSSAHLFDILILTVNCYLPKGVKSLQISIIVNQENVLFIVKLKRALLLIHDMKQVWKAFICLQI